MLTTNIHYQPVYSNFPIQFHPQGIHGEIMNSLHSLLLDMIERHCKVFYLRADIRFPDNGIQYPHDNDLFESFIADYKKSLQRKGIDLAYLYVREQNESINHHQHLCLYYDGNKVHHFQNVLEEAQRIWSLKLNEPVNNGLVHYCTRNKDGSFIDNGIMLIRNGKDFNNNFSRIMYSSSYLAKTYSKNCVRPGVRQFNHSRIQNKLLPQGSLAV